MHSLISITLASIISAVQAEPVEKAPVVVELFTSQSCSSCPPAEEYLRTLASEPNIIALEWHVDYWDQLVHGRAGKWKDPFSSPKHTARQRAYNQALRGRRAVYTPQTIINGQVEMVGSRRHDIRAQVDQSGGVVKIDADRNGTQINFTLSRDGSMSQPPLSAIFITFQKSEATEVKRGENHGKLLREAHIVTDFKTIQKDDTGVYNVQAPDGGQGCALILQNKQTMEVKAAAYCPA